MNTVVDFLKRYERYEKILSKNVQYKIKKGSTKKKENESEFGTKSSCTINCREKVIISCHT